MNFSFAVLKTLVANYLQLGIVAFSSLATITLVIYATVHVILFGNAGFQLDEVAALLRIIGSELLIVFFFLVLLFLLDRKEARSTRLHPKNIVPRIK